MKIWIPVNKFSLILCKLYSSVGTVVWCGLCLGDLRPEWVLPSLYPTLSSHSSSYTHSLASKRFVAKIKNSEARRNRRMSSGYIESNIEQLRNKCFRYRRPSSETSMVETIQETSKC